MQGSEPSGSTSQTSVRQTPRKKIIVKAGVVLGMLQNTAFLPFLDQLASFSVVSALQTAQTGVITQHVLNGLLQPICLLPGAVLPPTSAEVLGMAQDLIEVIAKLCRIHLANENAIPGPSSYAQHNTWVEWQKKETAILCFRPNGTQGLPLCVLDDVFRNFQLQATAPLPSTPEAAQAMNAAFNLCHTMPNHFKIEDDRSQAFDRCLVPLFRLDWWRDQVRIKASSEVHAGYMDRTYEQDGMICILREDKLETDTGDPYMQVARDYQLYAERARNSNRDLATQGTPMFLLCLLGPILLICGGFHDGKSTIVEPLAEPCLLFDDFLHRRQGVLARQLLALKEGVVALRNRPPVNAHVAGVPRVYRTYLANDGSTERALRWLSPLAASHPRSLLIVATEDPNAMDPNAVRLVKLVRKYGDEVHQLLAKSGFAPKLYGHRSLEGAPTAYVMEYLNPSAKATPGWTTLWHFFKSNEFTTRYLEAIEKTLNDILAVMEAASVVHGDLRPNNIMLEVGSDGAPVGKGEGKGANLKVVDFDWAGRSGYVCYPLQRNEDITWPASPGMSIVVAHDRNLVEDWWRQQFSSEFRRMER